MPIRGIASQKNPTILVAIRQQHVRRPGIRSEDRGFDPSADEVYDLHERMS